jgi:DNA repair exonuclease SbcCD ATPase subunit
MKLKNLRKKIQRLEKRLQEGPKKLAKLKEKLKTAEAAKALKAPRKSAARATAARPAANSPAKTAEAKKPAAAKKAKRKLNLSPERRAQLSAAMKARWAAKRAAGASTTTVSSGRGSAQEPTPQTPEDRPDGA